MSKKHSSPVRRPSLRTSTVMFGAAVISIIVAGLFGWVAELLVVFAFCSLAAAARGVYKGRAKVLNEEQIAQARTWVSEGIPKAEVARRLGIGRTTLYKYLNQ